MVATFKAARAIAPILIAALYSVAPAGQIAPKPAVPVDPLTGVLDAYRSHQVVFWPHGFGEARRALIYSMLNDARFMDTVTDIVIEFGSYRHQDVMDRFVRGDAISDEALRQAWERSTVRPSDPKSLEELARALRANNAKRPLERQMRLILGEPPMDPDNVPNKEDTRKWTLLRDSFPADTIRREVIARGRRAFVLYGQLHYLRKEILSNYDMGHWQAQTMVSLLESVPGTRVFTVWADGPGVVRTQPDAASWPPMRLALVRGTSLGAADFTVFDNPPSLGQERRFRIRGTEDFIEIHRSEFRSLRMEDQVDAILFTGAKQ